MSERTEYAPGTFCWPELVASDSDKAKEFYKALFNWEITDKPIGDGQVYSMASIRDKAVGAMYEMFSEQRDQGVPTHWVSYVSVANVDETVEKARSLGANVIVEPMDVFDAGRMAAIIDTIGAVISFWQPFKHIGAEIVNENGALVWNELATNETDKAKEFYSDLLGWTSQDMNIGGIDYTLLMNGEKMAGGIISMQEEWCDMPPVWFVYFAVDDCDGIVQKAESLGGKVVSPPKDLEGVGRMAMITDSQGALFAVIKLDQMPD